jgi:hypothetical protein
MKKIFVVFAMLCLIGNVLAQDEDRGVALEAGVDLVSSYIWRGAIVDDSPNLQPYASVAKGNFTLMYWGSYSPWNNYSETDFYLSYSLKSLTLSLNDYYTHNGGSYTNFDKYETRHMLEVSVQYEALAEKFPINLTLGTMVLGDDYNDEGNQDFSTYFEIEKPFSVNKFDFSAFLGTSLTGSYYADGFAVVNLGIKAGRTFDISDALSLPVSISAISNPDSKNSFVVGSVGFCFSK